MNSLPNTTTFARAGSTDSNSRASDNSNRARALARRSGRVLLSLVVLLATANQAAASLCIAVDFRFAGLAPSHRLVHTMQQEVASIWEPYGVHIAWPSPTPGDECRQVDGSFNVLVSRRVQPIALRTASPVLGRTWIAEASIVHVPIVIDYEATFQTIRGVAHDRLLDVARTSDVGVYEIGRALGRVLAHEIGHVLLAEPGHQLRGLMRRAFRSDDLVARERLAFALSSTELARLRDREHTIEARWRIPE